MIKINLPKLPKGDKDKVRKRNSINAGVIASGGALGTGYLTLRSGLPRVLGVRLESHSTTKDNARKILKNNGILDPKYGGQRGGISDYIKDRTAKGYTFITGLHKDNTKYKGNILEQLYTRIVSRAAYRNAPSRREVLAKIKKELGNQSEYYNKEIKRINKQISNLNTKTVSNDNLTELVKLKNEVKSLKQQRISVGKQNYRNTVKKIFSEANSKARAEDPIALIDQYKALTGIRGRTLYVGGSDNYFNNNFINDPKDLTNMAMKTNKPIKVYGNRFSATLGAIKKEGLVNLIKSNPKRILGGAAILGLGGLVTGKLLDTAKKEFANVKGYTRKSKKGRIVNVKSFVRKNTK